MKVMMMIVVAVFLVGCSTVPQPTHNPLAGCEYLETSEVPIPDLNGWVVLGIKASMVDENRIFWWWFYHDPKRPNVPVAAMVVGAVDQDFLPVSPPRLSWQRGKYIYTIRPTIKEMVCRKLIVGKLDLEHLRQSIMRLP